MTDDEKPKPPRLSFDIREGGTPEGREVMRRVTSQMQSEVNALVAQWARDTEKDRINVLKQIERLKPLEAAAYIFFFTEALPRADRANLLRLMLWRLTSQQFKADREAQENPPM